MYIKGSSTDAFEMDPEQLLIAMGEKNTEERQSFVRSWLTKDSQGLQKVTS